ncbi:hypothetical protein D3C85_1724980 [compost metagenome]
MVQVAEEFVETVVGRQVFILVAQVVLAELAGDVALGFECLGDGDVAFLQADRGTRHPDFRQPGT